MNTTPSADPIEPAALNRGLRRLVAESVASQTMGTLTGGAFLVALAIRLGANNVTIGLIAAAGPLSQVLQIPAIALVERFRRRKALVLGALVVSRGLWLVAAAVPLLPDDAPRLRIFFVCLLGFYGAAAISSCAFASWMRDLLPEDRVGRFQAKRGAISILVAAAAGLAAGFGIDFFEAQGADLDKVYAGLFLAGGALGLLSIGFISRVPEPSLMGERSGSLVDIFRAPFRDLHFRELLKFLVVWNVAVNLAAPFFTVYLLVNLKATLGMIMMLTVLSQLVYVVFLGAWGRLADTYGNRAVLTVAGPMYMLSLLMWPFLTLPERHAFTIPLLVGIHVLAGMSTAGVKLGANGIALKLAPRGAATSYLGVSAVLSGGASMLAPIVAGLLADWFQARELAVTLAWTSPDGSFTLPAVSARGLDFVFFIAALTGLYAVHRMLSVHEEGEVHAADAVQRELLAEMRRAVRQVSTVEGVVDLALFPFARMRDLVVPRKEPPK